MRQRAPVERETPYERHKATALRVLRRRCPWLAPDDCEAVYHDAYATLLEKHRDGALDMEAMHDAQVRSYLLTASINRALSESRRAEARLAVPTEDPGVDVPEPAAPVEDRLASESELAPIRKLVDELPERRRAVIKLRFWFDRSPPEIMAFLGISERAYRKEIERAFKQLAERYELVRQGRWCEERRSLVLAYVAGIAGPSRALEARRHLETCPACAHMARELRLAAERAAALLPLPGLAGHGLVVRLTEVGTGAKVQLSDLMTGAKSSLTSLAARADPSSGQYAVGARPGAAVAAIASCVAIGGGATYCAVQGLPGSIRALAPVSQEHSVEREQMGPAAPAAGDVPGEAPAPKFPSTTDQADASVPAAPVSPPEPPPTQADPAAEFAPPTPAPADVEPRDAPADASAAFAPGSGGSSSPGSGREFAP